MGQDILKEFTRLAVRSKSRVGIGVGEYNPSLLRAAAEVKRFSDLVFVGNIEEAEHEVVVTSDPERKLIEMLVDGTIDAAVRGTISARKHGKNLNSRRAPTRCAALPCSLPLRPDNSFCFLSVSMKV